MKHIFITSLIVATLWLPSLAHGEEKNPLISVSPSILRVNIAQDSSTPQITYTNTTASAVTAHIIMQPFSIGPSPAPENALTKYDLTPWVRFEPSDVVIQPGESKEISIILDKEALPTGSHYARIQAEIEQDKKTSTLGLKGILSSIIFIRGAKEPAVESATIPRISHNATYFSFPTSASVLFTNGGNVELVPYGEIRVVSVFGRTVAKGILNEDSLITLPETARTYDAVLARPFGIIWPGIYTIRADVHFGDNDQKISKTILLTTAGSFTVLEIVYALLFIFISAILVFRRKR